MQDKNISFQRKKEIINKKIEINKNNLQTEKINKEFVNKEKDYINQAAKRYEDIATRATTEVSKIAKNIMSGNLNETEIAEEYNKMKDKIKLSNNLFYSISDSPRNIQRSYYTFKNTKIFATNKINYLKGQEAKEYIKHKTINMKQHKKELSKYNQLNSLKTIRLNKELSYLRKKKDNKTISSDEIERLNNIILFKKEKNRGLRIEKGDRSNKRLRRNTFELFTRKINEEGQDSTLDALVSINDFTNNEYVKKALTNSLKLSYKTTSLTSKKAINLSKKVAEKTGIDKVIAEKVSNITSSETAAIIREKKKTVKKVVHGGAYDASKKAILSVTPEKAKIHYKNINKKIKTTKETTNKLKTAVKTKFNKILENKYLKNIKKFSTKIGRGITAPARFINYLKNKAMVVLGSIIIIILVLIVVISSVSIALNYVSSFFATDNENIQSYVDYIETLQVDFENRMNDDIEDTVIEHNSLNTDISYTHKSNIYNTKEILSMTAVYFDQDWIDFDKAGEHKIKDYIDQLFNYSHSYEIELSDLYYCEEEEECEGHRDIEVFITCLTFDDIFNSDSIFWDEKNIEWANIFYNQDWYEAYCVFVDEQYITISEEELAEIIDNISDLSENRKKVIMAAVSAYQKIPYYWNWRELINLQPGLENNDFGATVRPDKSGRIKLGLDCSGFVMWSFLTAGYDLNDIEFGGNNWGNIQTIVRSKDVVEISKDELKVGDMGVTKNAFTYGGNHIGIYLKEDQFIHLSVRGVVINNYPFVRFFRADFLD